MANGGGLRGESALGTKARRSGIFLALLLTVTAASSLTHETGEKKSSSFSKSEEAGDASHSTYTRISESKVGHEGRDKLSPLKEDLLAKLKTVAAENGGVGIQTRGTKEGSVSKSSYEARNSSSSSFYQAEASFHAESGSSSSYQSGSQHGAEVGSQQGGAVRSGYNQTVSSSSSVGSSRAAASQNEHQEESARQAHMESQARLVSQAQQANQTQQVSQAQQVDARSEASRHSSSDRRGRDEVRTQSDEHSRAASDAMSAARSASAEGISAASRKSEASKSASSSSQAVSELDKASVMTSDSDQRAYFEELFSMRCKPCDVNGRMYRGHSRFEYDDNCNRFRCVCSCDGSYNCPARYTIDICKQGAQGNASNEQPSKSRCQRCQALGHEFDGNSYFDVQDGCLRHRGCICYCNGTWSCPKERSINTCEGERVVGPARTCKSCNAKGKVVAGETYFDMEEPCRRYRYCRCRCDGSWECPEQYAEDTCKSPTTPSPAEDSRCRNCVAHGKEFQGNTYFELEDGCVEYKNCVCRCNGSWSCPSRYARNKCHGPGGIGRNKSYINTNTDCQSCYAFNTYHRGNTYFTARDGCTQYSRCVCRCDGSWDCPPRYASNVCTTANATSSTSDDSECSDCDARGKIVSPNTFFNLTEGCVAYNQCLCHCDGSWVCPEHFARNICDKPAVEKDVESEGCRNCHVDSRVVRGNSYFDRIDGCYRYRDCLCKCDGSYECQPNRVVNICSLESANASSTISSSSSSSESSSTNSSSAASSASGAAAQCTGCQVGGQQRAPRSRFTYEADCYEYDCECHCNGVYTCPAERARYICQPRCSECEVDGQFYDGNSYFSRRSGCFEYLCTCFCNGSWVCPADRANNTCTEGQTRLGSSIEGVNTARVESSCSKCVSNDGRTHAPETDFRLEQGCIQYRCRCNCDGSWNCPGEAARNICRGEALGGCRSCVISETQIYRGGENFEMRKECIHYKCRCNCDGSWECPGEEARDVCLGEVPGGCRVCRVSEEETYRGGRDFTLVQGCIHYQCKCNCNGSWECPGKTARNVCIGEVPGGCRVCQVEGQPGPFRGESDFQMVKDCIHYNCRCNCDGSWNCPGEKARRVCNADGSPLTSPQRPTTPQCRTCVVSDAERFQPGRNFTLRRGCYQYQCGCECDGSWNCPAERTRNLCERRDDPVLRAQTCQSCRVSSYVFPGRSSFLLTRNCLQFGCECNCEGRWTCNHTDTRNVCKGNDSATALPRLSSASSVPTVWSSLAQQQQQQRQQRQDTLSSSSMHRSVSTAQGSSVAESSLNSNARSMARTNTTCRPCLVDGKRYQSDSQFEIEKSCRRFTCYCRCNGAWRCPREEAVDICTNGRQTAAADSRAVSSSQSSSESRRVVSSATSSSKTQLDRNAESMNQAQSQAKASVDNEEAAAASRHNTDQRFGRTIIRVVGAAEANASSVAASSDSRQEGGSDGQQQLKVRGYYVDRRQEAFDRIRRTQGAQDAYSQQDSRQSQGQADTGDKMRVVYTKTEFQSGSQLPGRHYSTHVQGQDASNLGSQNGGQKEYRYDYQSGYRGQVLEGENDDYDEQSQGQAGGRQAQNQYYSVSKASSSASSSSRSAADAELLSRQMSSASAVASAEAGSESTDDAMESGCTPCQVDSKLYHAGAVFDWRRGCIVYKCSCLCSGSYRCRPTMDSDCRPEEGEDVAAGLPSWVLTGQIPGRTRKSCGNCYVQGYVYPGNMSFTLREGCYEMSCTCGCEGAHRCQGRTPIPGCTAVSTPIGGAAYPYAVPAGVYPNGYNLPARPGRVYSSFQTHYTASSASSGGACATCSGGLLIPVGVLPEGGQVDPAQMVPMMQTPVSDSGARDVEDKNCASCFVNGRSYRGSFEYTKDCYYITCYCDCSGLLRCSVQLASSEVCPPQYGPVSGRCRSCVVQGHEYPPSVQFALRVGCYGYECTCGCDGMWMCPTQVPTNYCVRPARFPPSIGNDKYETLASEVTDGHGYTAELKESSFSQSALEDPLSCTDCIVRDTSYPSRSRFLFRDGCLQHTCDCACDGSWSCLKTETVDVCQQQQTMQEEERREEMRKQQNEDARRQRKEEDMMTDRMKAVAEVAAHEARLASLNNKCQSCQVDGKNYLANSQFNYRQGCYLFTCQCFCNGSWECPSTSTRNLCISSDYRVDGCRECRVDNKTYPGGASFTHREGCWEFACHCDCNGQPACPPERSRNLCSLGGGSLDLAQSDVSETGGAIVPASACKPCMVDGQTIRSRSAFTQRRGCTEFLCQCSCNGTWTCPVDRSYNFCDLNNPSEEGSDFTTVPRKGCTVGRRTYYTRLFAFYDRCIQFMCICYDSGAWKCPTGKERYIC